MQTRIQFVNMPTSESFEGFIKEKIAHLTKKYDWLIKAEVKIKKENGPSPKGKICEIELSAPGPRIFASSNEASFEHAVVETIKDLDRQLKRRKQNMRSHM